MGLEDYELLELLGQGTYGKVYRVRKKSTNAICVLKQVRLDGISEKDQQETLNEARVMSQCEHFNIIKYHESFIELGNLNIIMDYAAGGDLAKKIRSIKNKPLEEDVIWNYLIQISQGLKYLHDKRILHRDIKPQNIFLDEDDNIKIGDMGLGRVLGPQSCYAYTGVGTPLYFSPELCEALPYNHKSDIWAFGCIIYELATTRPPFIASNQIALAKKIVSEQPQPLPKYYTMELQFLVFKMLEKDVNKRPDINQILNYSAVKIRIERAKLRHKELKLQEHYLAMERKLKDEFREKIERLELRLKEQQDRQIVADREKEAELAMLRRNNKELEDKNRQLLDQIATRDQEIKRLQDKVISNNNSFAISKQQIEAEFLQRESLLRQWEEKLLEKEVMLRKQQQLHQQQQQQYNTQQAVTIHERASSPKRIASKPSQREADKVINNAGIEKLKDLYTIINKTLAEDEQVPVPAITASPAKPVTHTSVAALPNSAVKQQPRSRSAPSTPLKSNLPGRKSDSNKPITAARQLSMTPTRAKSVSVINTNEYLKRTPVKSLIPSPTPKPLPRFPAHYFGVCSKKTSKQIPPFVALFAWDKREVPEGDKPCWGNEYKNVLLQPDDSLLVVYKVDQVTAKLNRFGMKTFKVLYSGADSFTVLNVQNILRMHSLVTPAKSVRFVFHVPEAPDTSNAKKPIEQFMIEFEHPELVEEVMILKYESRFIDIATISIGAATEEDDDPILRSEDDHSDLEGASYNASDAAAGAPFDRSSEDEASDEDDQFSFGIAAPVFVYNRPANQSPNRSNIANNNNNNNSNICIARTPRQQQRELIATDGDEESNNNNYLSPMGDEGEQRFVQEHEYDDIETLLNIQQHLAQQRELVNNINNIRLEALKTSVESEKHRIHIQPVLPAAPLTPVRITAGSAAIEEGSPSSITVLPLKQQQQQQQPLQQQQFYSSPVAMDNKIGGGGGGGSSSNASMAPQPQRQQQQQQPQPHPSPIWPLREKHLSKLIDIVKKNQYGGVPEQNNNNNTTTISKPIGNVYGGGDNYAVSVMQAGQPLPPTTTSNSCTTNSEDLLEQTYLLHKQLRMTQEKFQKKVQPSSSSSYGVQQQPQQQPTGHNVQQQHKDKRKGFNSLFQQRMQMEAEKMDIERNQALALLLANTNNNNNAGNGHGTNYLYNHQHNGYGYNPSAYYEPQQPQQQYSSSSSIMSTSPSSSTGSNSLSTSSSASSSLSASLLSSMMAQLGSSGSGNGTNNNEQPFSSPSSSLASTAASDVVTVVDNAAEVLKRLRAERKQPAATAAATTMKLQK